MDDDTGSTPSRRSALLACRDRRHWDSLDVFKHLFYLGGGGEVQLQDRRWGGARVACACYSPAAALEGFHDLAAEETGCTGDESCHGVDVGSVGMEDSRASYM